MSEPASTAMIAGPGEAGRQTPRGVRGGIIATGRGVGLAGLALAGLGLLLASLAGVFLVGLGFGVASHGSLPGLQRPALVAALVLGGLVLTRIITVPVLLGIRLLARLTRELTGQWAEPADCAALPGPARPRPAAVPRPAALAGGRPGDLARPGLDACSARWYGVLTAALPAIAVATRAPVDR